MDQIAAMAKIIILKEWKMPNMRISPGALAKPNTRNNSFGFDSVCGSGSSFVPIR